MEILPIQPWLACGRNDNLCVQVTQQIEPANLSESNQWTRIRYDNHSGALALGDFWLPLVFSKAEVWNSQIRCALDEIDDLFVQLVLFLEAEHLGCLLGEDMSNGFGHLINAAKASLAESREQASKGSSKPGQQGTPYG